MHWNPTDKVTPPEDIVLEAMRSDGKVSKLIYKHGRWWTKDMKMYVYYVPLFWRMLPDSDENCCRFGD